MSTDDIIRMAREAGFNAVLESMTGPLVFEAEPQHLERFAALVEAKAAANERDACAQVAAQTVCDTHIPTGINIYGTRAAKAIRARGNA